MKPDVRVDKAQTEDREIVLSLIIKQFEEHSILVRRKALEQSIAAVLANDKLGIFLLAHSHGRPVGVAYISFVWSLEHCGPSAWLEELYVLPEDRNRGVGSALLHAAIHVSQTHGCAAVDLEVEKSLARAENLYRREGFSTLPRARWVHKIDSNAR